MYRFAEIVQSENGYRDDESTYRYFVATVLISEAKEWREIRSPHCRLLCQTKRSARLCDANATHMGIEMPRRAGADSWIGVGLYSLTDASRQIRIPLAKLRRWAAGYWYLDGSVERFSGAVVAGGKDELDERILTFAELIELFFVGFFRREGVSMQVIRAARESAQQLFDVDYPFAAQRFDTDGRGIFVRKNVHSIEGVSEKQITLELSRGQLAFDELARPFFRTIDFDHGSAWRYWPLGRQHPIVVDARRSFGKPITQHGSIPTMALYQMVNGGQSLQSVASWYDVQIETVKAAVEYEETHRLAA
jgi:uncharacterized protein (DUF433 family)